MNWLDKKVEGNVMKRRDNIWGKYRGFKKAVIWDLLTYKVFFNFLKIGI